MKLYIPHRILVISSNITESAHDPVLLECYRLAFNWANDIGLQGRKVFDLFLERPDPEKSDPLNQGCFLWCKIECTEDERREWEELQKMKFLGNGLAVNEDPIDVPNGSILKCYSDGNPYWLTPEGEELLFDLSGLIRENS